MIYLLRLGPGMASFSARREYIIIFGQTKYKPMKATPIFPSDIVGNAKIETEI